MKCGLTMRTEFSMVRESQLALAQPAGLWLWFAERVSIGSHEPDFSSFRGDKLLALIPINEWQKAYSL